MTAQIRAIQEVVAGHYGLDVSDMGSHRSAIAIARPRQVAMYLCRRLTGHSLPTIGRKFGDRDHSTVIHAIRRIELLRVEDEDLDFDVAALARRVAAQHQSALNDALIGWVA